MDLGLSGKTAIVTGGGSNIGRAIVLTLAREGANVVIADIDETQAGKVAKEVHALNTGAKGVVIKTDVSNHVQVEETVQKAIGQFGQVHILVNNVGWTIDRLFLEKAREEWEKEVRLNLWGPINCCRAVLPHMVEKGYGRVVNIASDAGRIGEYREAVYAACKAGVIALAKALARETGRYGVNFNSVCPGMTVPQDAEEAGESSMWTGEMREVLTDDVLERVKRAYPLRRLGTAQEVANAVAFLASDAASFITGQTLSVSGGYSMM